MSNISFENFGSLGKTINKGLHLASGRHLWMKRNQKFIINDIIDKLSLSKSDSLLDVGCGDGTILKELSKKVKSATGFDHTLIIKQLKKKYNKKIIFIDGDIKKHHKKIKKKFEKILLYSVIHYFKNPDEVTKIIGILLSKLKSPGMMLIGDVPNSDLKKKIMIENRYKKIKKNWEKKIKNITKNEKLLLNNLKKDNKLVKINNNFILKLCKKFCKKNCQVFILKQNNKLPMYLSRLDILIVRY